MLLSIHRVAQVSKHGVQIQGFTIFDSTPFYLHYIIDVNLFYIDVGWGGGKVQKKVSSLEMTIHIKRGKIDFD